MAENLSLRYPNDKRSGSVARQTASGPTGSRAGNQPDLTTNVLEDVMAQANVGTAIYIGNRTALEEHYYALALAIRARIAAVLC